MMRKLSSVDIVKAFFSFVLLLSIGIQSVEASISPVTSFTLRRDWNIDGTADEMTVYPSYSGFWGCITNAKTSTPEPWIDETFFEYDMRGLSVQSKMFLETPLRTMFQPVPPRTADVKIAYYSGSGVPDYSRLGKGTFFYTEAVASEAGDTYYIDVTNIYNNFIDLSKSYLGFRFYQPVWTDTSNGTQVFTDYLAVLTPIPEPATLLLLGFGAVMLRRKR